ncbi:MAG: helix-turn-helix domain-containing protein [Tissierellia bacterium]|nr:helix-turn-helix domain-containing protein [Tissierellia bacterium]
MVIERGDLVFNPNNLKQLRLEKGLTQKEVAEQIGVSQQQWSQYEKGEAYPRISTAKEIADFFGSTVDEIFLQKETGKGLSMHDLTTERKNKVDAIPANPKYTDTIPDLSPYLTKTSAGETYATKSEMNSIDVTAQLKNYQKVESKGIAGGYASLGELNYTRAMTQAQYDALSDAEKNRTDVWYGIYEE